MQVKRKSGVTLLILLAFLLLMTGCGKNTTPKSNRVECFDGFSDSGSGWSTFSDEHVTRRYINERYEIDVTRIGYVYLSIAPLSKFPVVKPAYSVEVEMELTQGQGYGGLVFDCFSVGENLAYTIFLVNTYDGIFKVESYHPQTAENKGWTVYHGWTKTETIKANEVNRIKVTREVGGKVSFYINDQIVLESITIDYPSVGSRFGLIAANNNELSSAITQFDNFRLSGEKL